MLLEELGELLAASRLSGERKTAFTGIQTDHRKVKQGDLFVCIPGQVHDGHAYAALAAEQGAVALVVERDVDVPLPKLRVKDTRHAMGAIAGHFYGYPSRELKLIGVTGTNGKTTTTFLLERILSDQGNKTGLMGTIQTKIGSAAIPAERTTQEALDLQRALRRMVNEGADYCVMEVSSHALDLGRVKGCRFRSAIFTNLTQDHLDYHGTMAQYRDAKGLLFARMGNDCSPNPEERGYAVLNADDPASETYARVTAAQTITYGIDREADVMARDIRFTIKGAAFTLDTFAGRAEVTMRLIGKFNVYNTLAAVAAALLERIPLADIADSLAAIEPVDGRMQTVDEGQDFLVLVDYAHTPDGLENALRAISEFAACRVITVFGCGGDRDRGKRPVMGRIAAEYSDYVVVTSDNPRSEEPQLILREIAEGIAASGYPQDRYVLEENRAAAIRRAIAIAEPNDVVLIAGKGHETYQILRDRTIDFDDRVAAADALRELETMIRATLKEIAGMIPGAAVAGEWASVAIAGVSKDTRSLPEGSLYIPLAGKRYDGHHYAAEAVARGAAASLWQRDRGEAPGGVPVIAVDDCLIALQQLAAAYRRQLPVKVIGITGSNGKTSTKDMVSAVLGIAYRVHKTIGNLNNHIGLPLTLLELDERTEFAVLEMGMSGRGEIELLSRLAEPDCAIITNIGEAHLLQLGSREGIAAAKFEITAGLKRGGLLIYDGDEPLLNRLVDDAGPPAPFRAVRFGRSRGNDYYAEAIEVSLERTTFAVTDASGGIRLPDLRIPLLGRHNAVNALAAVAAGLRYGVDAAGIRGGLSGMQPTGMRLEAVTSASGATLLNDAYNASPLSMSAALQLLEELAVSGRKIAVLGDMLELGPDAERFHREIGRSLSPQRLDYVFAYGELAAYIAEECRAGFGPGRVEAYADKAGLIERLSHRLDGGDIVLFKASRGMKLEEVVEAVRQT